jgi:hypothetical protein
VLLGDGAIENAQRKDEKCADEPELLHHRISSSVG